jgi:hypothetical protein
MNLADYFANRQGTGILATADGEGRVNAAVFSRPHILKDGRVAFIMPERLTFRNLRSNPHATYLFLEQGSHWAGKRLYLYKTGEEKDSERLQALRRGRHGKKDLPRYLVFFKLEQALPLIGAGTDEEGGPAPVNTSL